MLEISNVVVSLLKGAFDAQAMPEGVLRLVPSGGSSALKVASADDGEAIAVLAAPLESAKWLGSQMMDVEETNKGPRLIVLSPSAGDLEARSR